MVNMMWSLRMVILVAGSWTMSLPVLVNGFILPTGNATNPNTQSEPWEPLHMYRTKNNIEFNYRTKAINPEMCRYLDEDSCEVLDERFHSHTQKRQEHLKQQQQERQLQKGGPKTGSFKVLCLLLQFSDHAAAGKVLVPADELRAALNGVGVDETLYPAGSFADFISVSSYNTLAVTTDVIDWQTTDNTEAYYADGRAGYPGGTVSIEQAILPLLNAMDAQGFDFSQYDSDFDGFIDVLMVLHSGYSAELGDQTECAPFSVRNDRINSFSTGASPGLWISSRLVEVGAFTFASAYRGLCEANVARIGVIAHEFGHTFGLPDLYDDFGKYEGEFAVGGIAGYDVMANPAGVSNSLAYPGIMSPWCKYSLGWATPLMIESDGVYTARASATNPDIFMISAGGYAIREFLLIENRQPLLYDINLPTGGLLIYHIDESSNDMRGFPGQADWPTNGNHYQIALLQADGLYELEKAASNGEAGDFFLPGMELGPGNGGTVYPNTDAYNGGIIVETGIRIFNILEVETGVYSFEVSGLGGSTGTTPSPVAGATPAPATPAPTTSKPTLSPSTSFAPTVFGQTRSPTAVVTSAPTTTPEPPTEESPTATPPAAVTSAGTAASAKWSFWKMTTTTVMAVATVLISSGML